jgi:transcriptional regulator with XRE-family HTH domain
METTSQVARFIQRRIEETGQTQKDIAFKVGFEKPNIITMIKQGKTRLPLDKIGLMANALETDPAQLFHMCMEEYQPATWKVIAPFMEGALTKDELRLLNSLRAWVGGPFLSALSEESKEHFNKFMASMRTPATIQ